MRSLLLASITRSVLKPFARPARVPAASNPRPLQIDASNYTICRCLYGDSTRSSKESVRGGRVENLIADPGIEIVLKTGNWRPPITGRSGGKEPGIQP